MVTTPPAFTLPNVSVGPDPLSLSDVTEQADFAVLLLLRDYHCPKCRAQVENVAERAQELSERNVAVVAVLPEPVERTREWEGKFDLPFPVLADPEKTMGERYDQPTRFGALGRLHDLIGRMPKTVILDTRGERPEVLDEREGTTPQDRPSVDELLDTIDDLRESFVFDCALVNC
jgi:peroxiredoxin Q/BCP